MLRVIKSRETRARKKGLAISLAFLYYRLIQLNDSTPCAEDSMKETPEVAADLLNLEDTPDEDRSTSSDGVLQLLSAADEGSSAGSCICNPMSWYWE